MIVLGRRSASQTGLTIAYRIRCPSCETGWCIWFGHRVAYHSLPFCRSGSEPVVWNLYQRLPPRRRQLTIDLAVGEVVWVIIAYNDGEPWTPSEVAHTVGQVSKRKSSDRPVGLQKIEHGGKTGRAMIKYPHTKKNAQQENRSAYPGR